MSKQQKAKRASGKKGLNLIKLARQKMESKVDVRDGERTRRMSKGELGVIKLVNRFMETGDPKIYWELVDIVHPGGGGPEVIQLPPSSDVTQWSDDDVREAALQFLHLAPEQLTEEDMRDAEDVLEEDMAILKEWSN